MTREEAIKEIREWDFTNMNKDDMEVLATLIPELAESESEDESIRKTLKEAFKAYYVESTWHGIPIRSILAWLEKQKEQKPAEWSDTDNIGWDEAFACVTRTEITAKNEEELQNAVTAEKWLKEIKFKYCVHPVKQEWSEEDEKFVRG